MPLGTNIEDPRNNKKAWIDSPEGEDQALIVATRDLKTYDTKNIFFKRRFTSSDINMNVNGSVGGTPEIIHDGTDLVKWTASTVAGTWDYTSTTHAYEGVITVVDYSLIDAGADSFTINSTTRVATTHWAAATSNAITADNIRDDINSNVVGFTAVTGASATVIVKANAGYDITTFSTNATAAEMLATGRSINGTSAGTGGEAYLTRASAFSTSPYSSLSFYVYLTAWKTGQNIVIRTYLAGVLKGNSVNLNSYMNVELLNQWQVATIPLSALGIAGISIDRIGIQISHVGIKPYFDVIQFDETAGGANVEFVLEPESGKWLYVTEMLASFADEYDGTLTNGTMPGLSYNKILNESPANGYLVRLIKNGITKNSRTVANFKDMLQNGGTEIVSYMDDGTNVFVTVKQKFAVPMLLKSEDADNINVTIRDNMTGLLHFRINALCYEEDRE